MPDYNQLLTDITDYTARTDIPNATFISLAEQEMNRVLRIQAMEELATVTPAGPSSTGIYNIMFPTGLLDVVYLAIAQTPLEYRTNRQFASLNEQGANNWDIEANVYTISDETIFLFRSEEGVLTYRKAIDPLSLTNLNNWFSDNAYDALLYLSLGHAGIYMKEPSEYRQQGMERLAEIQTYDDQARYSGAPLVQRG